MPSTDPDPQTIALPLRQAAVKLARQRFGFRNLRPGQLEAIDAVVSGHDALVVMPTGSAAPFPVGSRVRHVEWGTGQVLGYEEDKVTVLFEEVGYRTLGVKLVLEQGLLEAATPGG
jgi:Protein of unknown function (DUF3553)